MVCVCSDFGLTHSVGSFWVELFDPPVVLFDGSVVLDSMITGKDDESVPFNVALGSTDGNDVGYIDG